MGLIFVQPDIKTHFIMQWTTKYVPAILEYASKSVKKYPFYSVKHEGIPQTLLLTYKIYFHYVCIAGFLRISVSKGVGALKILGESLDKKKSIVYMYEEYNVS